MQQKRKKGWTNPFSAARKRRQDAQTIQEWRKTGSGPPPHILKQQTVLDYGRRFGILTFVETGTFMGDMVDAVADQFDQVHSVELGPDLFEKARLRFAGLDHVRIHQGDSAAVLPEILRSLNNPALFWLDGHYSAGITAKGQKDTPIIEELEAIYRHNKTGHVILIDDARLFDGSGDYPSLDDLRRRLKEWSPTAVMETVDDIIRLHPSEAKR
jgi:hypothetical protein